MKRVVDFIVQKRTKDDIALFFDGWSKARRWVFEQAEEKIAASGAHSVTEFWIAYVVPPKKHGPRVPSRQVSFVTNNKEVAICGLPNKCAVTVIDRAEFNSCGENPLLPQRTQAFQCAV